MRWSAIARPALALLIGTVLAFLIGALLRAFLTGAGEAAAAALLRFPPGDVVAAVLKAVLALLAIPVVVFAWRRAAPAAGPLLPLAALLAWATADYAASLRDRDRFTFAPGIVTLRPGSTIEDHNPLRPQHPYRINALGFREPEIALVKPAGTVRGALIGDSYVFGIGVPADETLARHLGDALAARHPRARFEVVNLGMPGNNMASYVDLHAAARARLDLDFVVLCLTLPNDLSRWDWPAEWREAHRVSAYSLARWLVGAATASRLWGVALLEEGVRPAAAARFTADLRRLLAAHAAMGSPPMVVFTYGYRGEPIAEATFAAPGLRLLAGRVEPDDFIAGDGHPTAGGNRHFASQIAAALAAIPEFAALTD